jgi:hypothetical protein
MRKSQCGKDVFKLDIEVKNLIPILSFPHLTSTFLIIYISVIATLKKKIRKPFAYVRTPTSAPGCSY